MTGQRKIAFIHTSPPAIGPLMKFYGESAPELEITNLLDDGLLRLLAAKNLATAEERLADMIGTAVAAYGAELAMITCSSVPKEMAARLDVKANVPVVKIDYPMAREAVRTGAKIGLVATFPPALVPTSKLLNEAAEEMGARIEIIEEVSSEAYTALLANDLARHDELLLAAVKQLEGRGVSVIVLAQVSMARILPSLEGNSSVPVLSSLHTSLAAIREALNGVTK